MYTSYVGGVRVVGTLTFILSRRYISLEILKYLNMSFCSILSQGPGTRTTSYHSYDRGTGILVL